MPVLFAGNLFVTVIQGIFSTERAQGINQNATCDKVCTVFREIFKVPLTASVGELFRVLS